MTFLEVGAGPELRVVWVLEGFVEPFEECEVFSTLVAKLCASARVPNFL